MGFLVLYEVGKYALGGIWEDLEIEFDVRTEPWWEVWDWVREHVRDRSKPLNELTGTIQRILNEGV